MALATAAVAAGTWAAAAYVDAKYGLSQDLSIIRRIKLAERDTAQVAKDGRLSIWYIIEDRCKEHWNERAIWTRERTYTFGELYEQSVRYATWMLDQGIKPGDLVAMYLINSAEFIMIWFASLSIGAAPAFINYNLEGESLLHCLGVCDSKILIVDDDEACQRRINGSREQIEASGNKIFIHDADFKQQISSRPVQRPGDAYRKGVTLEFPFCLIYTSGTTGFPKGCAFTTGRVRLLGSHMTPAFNTVPGVDCWYCSMPLYHGTGSITTSVALLGGVGVAIAPRFSVSKFWNDVHDSGATLFIYVGETARYLLNSQPPHPLERKHRLRCAYGNGLRPDVWRKLQERFNIPEIAEFFNSTEGMFSLINYDRGPFLAACVGHHGLILRTLFHNVYIPVLIDHTTGDIWRDPQTGFANRTPYTEGGEILVAVPERKAFQGYWKAVEATDKKFCTDVFRKGDLYYRTGDALRRDADGRWYFLDRLGDTFRWKSENVSTAEVSECLGHFPGIAEANVYGVLVPNHEGRAGCVALDLDANANSKGDLGDFSDLLAYASARLPRYAVPVFLRLVKASTHIHNHKQNKVPLRKEGIDPALIGTEAPEGRDDVILWLRDGKYVPFTPQDWAALQAGQVRL
ncbi:hypothetical protein DV736_g6116, partial [Chaetothyriales sp. CBS 134916]